MNLPLYFALWGGFLAVSVGFLAVLIDIARSLRTLRRVSWPVTPPCPSVETLEFRVLRAATPASAVDAAAFPAICPPDDAR